MEPDGAFALLRSTRAKRRASACEQSPMGCILAGIAFFFPRLTIILLVIFGDYIGRAYDTWFWPLLGFFFMPYTTLAYALAKNHHGSVEGLYLVLVIVAVLLDLGVIGGGAESTRRRGIGKVRATNSVN